MNTSSTSPPHNIFLLSFNRPHYLQATLESLLRQSNRDWRILLFQDGPRSGPHEDEDSRKIGRCVSTFLSLFPEGQVIRQTRNIGIGLNVLNAHRHAFQTLDLDVAYFFEDDLVLHERYIEQMAILEDVFRPHQRLIPYFAAYGTIHTVGISGAALVGSDLRFIDHLWGFGLFRSHWEEEQKLLKPYFDYLASVDYTQRDHELIRAMYRDLGFAYEISSQDGAAIVALCVLGRCAVTTIQPLARYIGETGIHWLPEEFHAWGFHEVTPSPDAQVVIPYVSEKLPSTATSRFPHWARTLQNLPPKKITTLRKKLDLAKTECQQVLRTQSELRTQTAATLRRLKEVESSTCWKITGPIRGILDFSRTFLRPRSIRARTPLTVKNGVVAVDVTNIWHADTGTGIQRVVREIATGLTRIGTAMEFVLIEWSSGTPVDVTAEFITGDPSPSSPREISAMETIIMLDSSYHIALRIREQLHDAKQRGIRIVSVCHDVFPVTFPQLFEHAAAETFKRWLSEASLFSDAFLCNSRHTASELRKYQAGLKPGRKAPAIGWWPLGSNFSVPGMRLGEEGTDQRDSLDFLLMVGTVEPRKNYDFALDALEELWNSGRLHLPLVVVGRPGWKCKHTAARLHSLESKGHVSWHRGGLPDEQLRSLYRHANAVIQASLDEGFGLPVAEAAHFAKPVVLSDIPIFREIVMEHGYYFTQGDAESFASALFRALEPGAPPTRTTGVSWEESSAAFWNECARLLESSN